MQPNDRVTFRGPAYIHADGPRIGQQGTVVELGGYIHPSHGEREALVTVHFDGDPQATVVSMKRVTLNTPNQ